jgi:type VI secretion system protein ImpK
MTRRSSVEVQPPSVPLALARADGRPDSSLLVRHFREFYREVVRLKNTVEQTASVGAAEPLAVAAAAASGVTAGPAWTPSPVQPVWQQLLAILERQALEAGHTGGAFGFEIYREAQYLMAAFADEVFLNTNWEGKGNWPLLESRLFQTHYAGDAVFQKLDRIVQRRDPFYLDLASVYFLVLSLGFQGRYRGAEDRTALEVYRRQLFVMIHRRNPRLFTSSTPLFPHAYDHTLDKVAPRKLPDQKNWLWLLMGIFVMWFVVSHLAWTSLSAEINCLICKTTGAVCACDVGAAK